MSIKDYTAYFHDGAVFDIKQIKDKIEISMSSAEIDLDEVKCELIIASDNTIKGKLHIEHLQLVKVNDIPIQNVVEKKYDKGSIYDLDIYDNRVELFITWSNHYPKKYEETDLFKYEFIAEKIYWENIPKIAPPFW